MLIYEDLKNIKEDYLIITKSDVENLGKKTLKDVYKILNIDWSDLYIEELITKIKEEKDKLDEYLINSIYHIKKFKKAKYFDNKFNTDNIEDLIEYESKNVIKSVIYDETKKSYYIKEIEKKIENESFDIDLIFEVLSKINLTWEMDEDAFCQKKAFLNIYDVFYNDYNYLEY